MAVRFVPFLMLPSRGPDQLVFSASHGVQRQEQSLGWQAVPRDLEPCRQEQTEPAVGERHLAETGVHMCAHSKYTKREDRSLEVVLIKSLKCLPSLI